MFHVGQKVVRTRQSAFSTCNPDPTSPGEVYTVAGLRKWSEYDFIAVAETPDHWYDPDLFRPVAFDFDELLATKPADLPLVEMDMEIEARVRELNQVWSA